MDVYAMGISETEIRQCFKVLELDSNASLDDVRKAFRNIVKIWHPDLYAGSPQLKAMAEEKLKAVNAAYAAVKSYLALRRDVAPRTKARKIVFSNPFAWLGNRNLKWFQGEYAKNDKMPLNPFRYQTTVPSPKQNERSCQKDFKQVLQEVAAAGLRSREAGQGIL
jgi:curved DNA-binding protein CbpA